MGARTARTTLYSIILGLSICVNGLAIALAVVVSSDVDYPSYGSPSISRSRSRLLLAHSHFAVRFGIVAAVVAPLTWIWTSVLLAWNNKPRSNSGLAISLTHFISFIIMSLLWFAVAILLLTETRYSCSAIYAPGSYLGNVLAVWCGMTSSIGALSLVISILCGATALVILLTCRKAGGLYAKLVASDGSEHAESALQPMKHATRVRTALYSLILVFGLAINGVTPVSAILTIYETVYETDEGLSYLGGADTAFMAIAFFCALFTWIWASVLLAYHRRIKSTDTITRASAHCISTMVLSIVWLVLGIIILGLTGTKCTPGIESFTVWGYCAFNIPVGVLALCLSILLSSASLFIYLRTKSGGASLSKCHVAQFDGGATEVFQSYHTHDMKAPMSDSDCVTVPTSHHCCHDCEHTRA
ncbi:hypothetical protein E1B28_005360 [Marasmius oreades]|uniref:Uncharacterized protein n=1 Tax=Marasmius oreades TaxID=181124 RepID=A0A9P7UVM0_9AGAR|nr:uncharacterized protein E1B28_005360 [Marasmius oreades]KAG7094531.1 hypothetical protein E1B28_005360 [Marasmius oreades]